MNALREALRALVRGPGRRGQGTVEYLGLVLAVGALLLAVSVQVKGGGAGIGGQISKSMEKAISSVAQP
ncbi:MAG: hypothetical protein ACR2JV_08695 [Gaiellales bacterium]